MQILTEILILLKKNTFIFKDNHSSISIWVTQSNMEELLNNLLHDYVSNEVIKISGEKICWLEGRLGYERCVALIVRNKLKSLNEFSIKIIFNRVIDLVEHIKSK